MRARLNRVALILLGFGVAVAVPGLTGCGPSIDVDKFQGVTLKGGGSELIRPVMSGWTEIYGNNHQGVKFDYQAVGSNAGVAEVARGAVDFSASDYALDDSQLGTMKPVLQIPETAGPVCITYNLPGLKQPLQLSAETIAGIFLGRIKSWQDPILKRENPHVTLPKLNIGVVYRSDDSGMTAALTDYLSSVSGEWRSKVGKGLKVSWPVGMSVQGSSGMAQQVAQTAGSIGYVELTVAQHQNLPVASVKNLAGKYVVPSVASTMADIDAFAQELSKDPRSPVVNPPASAETAYPISALMFLIVPKDGPDTAKRAALKGFVSYVLGDGQPLAGEMNFAPLPPGVKQYDQQMLSDMTAKGQAIL